MPRQKMLFAEAEVRSKLSHLHRLLHKLKESYERKVAAVQRRIAETKNHCPHTKTHLEYGQYMPCETVCDICGKEL